MHARSMHRCYPAHAHILTHHPPHINKLERQPQAKTTEQNASHMLTSIISLCSVPRSCHQLLSTALVCARGLGSRQQSREVDEQLGFARWSNLLSFPLICCFNPSLIPQCAFNPSLSAPGERRSISPLKFPAEAIRSN